MLCAKDREFINSLKRNQKLLMACGLVVLFLAIFCIYAGSALFDKAGYISVTQRAHDEIARIETKTPLEFRLKETALENLEFEISQYRLIKVILIILISFSLSLIGMGCFIFFAVNKKFLNILKDPDFP